MPDTATHRQAKQDHQENRNAYMRLWRECLRLKDENQRLRTINQQLQRAYGGLFVEARRLRLEAAALRRPAT